MVILEALQEIDGRSKLRNAGRVTSKKLISDEFVLMGGSNQRENSFGNPRNLQFVLACYFVFEFLNKSHRRHRPPSHFSTCLFV